GVVTSPTGAVIRDILHRLNDRFPRHVLLWPVLVQGDGAAAQIADAIAGFNTLDLKGAVPRPDLLIVARGGGSLEDLWAFNEEIVVRAAAASEIPLISAVGHETDTTLIDYASDQRAPTPTAAAEMAVPVRAELQGSIMDLGRRQFAAMTRHLDEQKVRLEGLGRGLPDLATVLAGHNQRLDSAVERLGVSGVRLVADFRDRVTLLGQQIKPPRQAVEEGSRRLARESEMLTQAMTRAMRQRADRLKAAGDLLESVSFRRIVERGYTVVWDRDGKPVTSAAAASPGAQVTIEFADGNRDAEITDDHTKMAKPKRKKSPAKKGPDDRQGELL
ncbi:MAG TPA: exodeoxyribonuclease VII large subunit, partial [Rhodospirillaceae bacterium]|nr:exodeoxyribonuclease VII large subunit [Rhodospirillaceae bacterium]